MFQSGHLGGFIEEAKGPLGAEGCLLAGSPGAALDKALEKGGRAWLRSWEPGLGQWWRTELEGRIWALGQ